MFWIFRFLAICMLSVTARSPTHIQFTDDVDSIGKLKKTIEAKLICNCPDPVNNITASMKSEHFNGTTFEDNRYVKNQLLKLLENKGWNEKCTPCQVELTQCYKYISSSHNICNKTSKILEATQELNEINETIIREIYIPPGLGHQSTSRHVRQTNSCPFPTSMETAAISCRIFPSSIKCVQKCAFGYTLKNGIQQMLNCTFSKNQWVPTGFKECQPFVDCTLSLIMPGTMRCSTPYLERGPECAVECFHYEDKSAVPVRYYTCTIDGVWDPPLPFCIAPGSGLALVKKPEIKYHDEFYQ